jgi:hypothetical protein
MEKLARTLMQGAVGPIFVEARMIENGTDALLVLA